MVSCAQTLWGETSERGTKYNQGLHLWGSSQKQKQVGYNSSSTNPNSSARGRAASHQPMGQRMLRSKETACIQWHSWFRASLIKPLQTHRYKVQADEWLHGLTELIILCCAVAEGVTFSGDGKEGPRSTIWSLSAPRRTEARALM